MKRKMNYHLNPAREMSDNIQFSRIGIIPYFIHNDSHHFFLMLDAKYQEITDCGGLPKAGETWIETAIRETEEESRGVFSFNQTEVRSSGTIFSREDNRIAIIFLNINHRISTPVEAANVCYNYRVDFIRGVKSRDRRERLENSDMLFYTKSELKSQCDKNKVYLPVRRLMTKFFVKGHYRKLGNPLQGIPHGNPSQGLPPDLLQIIFGNAKLETPEETQPQSEE